MKAPSSTRPAVKLTDVADVLAGFAFKSKEYIRTESEPKLLRGINLTPGKIDWSECARWLSTNTTGVERFSLAQGDIVVGMDRPWISSGFRIAVIQRADLPCYLVQRVARLRAGEQVDQRYLFHLLSDQGFQRHLKGRGTETTVPHISSRDIESFTFELPPLPEQRRIAAILDKADAIRRKRQETIRLTEEFLRSAFLDMFGDPVTNPKGWPVCQLGELIVDGPNNGLYRPASDYGSGTPIIRIDSFYDGEVTATDLKRVRIESDVIEKFSCQPGDVLINRVNSKKYLGKCAIVPPLREATVYESNMMRFSLDEQRIAPWFLVYLLGHPYGRRQILGRARDAVNQSSINQQDVKSIEVLLPPRPLQHVCIEMAGRKNGLRERAHSGVRTVEWLFNSLVQRAFQGSL